MELVDTNLFEYKDVVITNRRKGVYVDCIKNFGWEVISENESESNTELVFKRSIEALNLKDEKLEQTLDMVMMIKEVEHHKNLEINTL